MPRARIAREDPFVRAELRRYKLWLEDRKRSLCPPDVWPPLDFEEWRGTTPSKRKPSRGLRQKGRQ